MSDLQSALAEHFESTLDRQTMESSFGLSDEDRLVNASLGGILDVVKAWLEAAGVDLPSKADVLKFVGEAYDTYIAPRLASRPFINQFVKQGLLAAVSVLYDSFL